MRDLERTDPLFVTQRDVEEARKQVDFVINKNNEYLNRSEETFGTETRAAFKAHLRSLYREIDTAVKPLDRIVRDMQPNRNVAECSVDVDSDFKDTDVKTAVETQATKPPFSFDSGQWEAGAEWKAKCKTNANKTNWAKLAPYLVQYLLDDSYAPTRYRTKADEGRVDVPGALAGHPLTRVSTSVLDSFHCLKDHVRINKHTGALVFLTADEDQKYATRRVVWRPEDQKDTFGRVWSNPLCGAHRGRDSLYSYWSQKFVGVSRRDLDVLLRDTELNQIQRSSKIAEKVTNPLVTSNPMEHLQMDLVIFESMSKYNDGYAYILVVVDCFSKFLWTFPLKRKRTHPR